MRCLVVGCGSIGTRRAKILAGMGHEVHGYDPAWSTKGAKGGSITDWCLATGAVSGASFLSGDTAYDAALICTPPDSGRPEQIQRCLNLGVRGLFVEKPLALDLSDVSEVLVRLARATNVDTDAGEWPRVTTMGACNLRFVGGISGLKKIPKPWRLAAFRMGQHKKHWSPTHRPISMILDSIHELDLAVHLQGPIESIRGYRETDVAEVSVHHTEGGLSHLLLDRTTDPPVRSVTITRNGDRDFLRLMTNDGMYQREMAHFLECVEKGTQTCNPLRQAAEVCARALEVA